MVEERDEIKRINDSDEDDDLERGRGNDKKGLKDRMGFFRKSKKKEEIDATVEY